MEKVRSKTTSRVRGFALSHLSFLSRTILELQLFPQFETPPETLLGNIMRKENEDVVRQKVDLY
jgi:hypothetical protein